MNAVSYFEIQSAQPNREIRFYESVFGWKFIKEDFHSIEYYRIETGSMYGGLLKRSAKVPPAEFGTNAYTCSIQVANFDTVADLIIKGGGQIALPKFAVPGRCWQGYFMDQDNNAFGIFQVDSSAK